MKILFVFHPKYFASKTFHTNTMSLAVVKSINRKRVKDLKLAVQNLIRMMSTSEEPCSGKPAEPPKPKEPVSKTEPCPAPASSASACPKPPPCPPPPHCPPRCPSIPDSNNPCNYTPPPCPDPSDFSMSRIKKWQCFFQEENDIPLFLKRGTLDAIVFQSVSAVLVFLFLHCMYVSYLVRMKS